MNEFATIFSSESAFVYFPATSLHFAISRRHLLPEVLVLADVVLHLHNGCPIQPSCHPGQSQRLGPELNPAAIQGHALPAVQQVRQAGQGEGESQHGPE